MRSCLALVALSALLAPGVARAQSPPSDSALNARLSVKATTLVARAPDAPWLFPVRDSTRGLGRARLDLGWRPPSRWSAELTYEQSLLLQSSGATDDGLLPGRGASPYRVRPLAWRISSDDHRIWAHEIDRAAVRVQWPAAHITAGRQAVGWGRGLMFSAVDVFVPFSPLDADREWRRGVDAVRAEVKLGERTSAELIGAIGARTDASVFGARVRGYTDRFDIELVGGRRAGDRFIGVTTSLAVGGAEFHGECAVFATPAVPGSSVFGQRRTVAKVVAGGSSRVPIGNGLVVDAEYHYSGFGAARPDDLAALLADPAFGARYARGDTQLLGRHAIALIASYEWSPLVNGSLNVLLSPGDGSGLLMPTVTITPDDRWSLLLAAYVPYGPAASRTTPRSEYGLTPLSLSAQVRLYR